MPEALLLAASENEQIVDVNDHPNSHRPEVPDDGLQNFRCQPGSWGEAERHHRALILLALSHEPEVLTVLGLDGEMKEVIGLAVLGHEVPTTKEVPHCMQALHLEVLVPQVAVERAKV